VAATVVIGVLAAVNRRGLSESAGVNVCLPAVDIATQAAIIVLGAALGLDPARPVEQIHLSVGGLGTAAAWAPVVVLHGDARVLGGAWMVLGVAGYLAYRSALRLKPRELHRRGLEPPDRLARFTRQPVRVRAHRGRTRAGGHPAGAARCT
jgi:hypothetical protein